MLSRLLTAEMPGTQGHGAPYCFLIKDSALRVACGCSWPHREQGHSSWDPCQAPQCLLRSLACYMSAHQTLNGVVEPEVGWILMHGEFCFIRGGRPCVLLPPWGLGAGYPLQPFPAPWEEEGDYASVLHHHSWIAASAPGGQRLFHMGLGSNPHGTFVYQEGAQAGLLLRQSRREVRDPNTSTTVA